MIKAFVCRRAAPCGFAASGKIPANANPEASGIRITPDFRQPSDLR
jgi:hypothetical protein